MKPFPRQKPWMVKVEVLRQEPMPLPSTKVLELDMEKRGVVLDDEKTKTAEQTKRCPACGAELDEPNKCPNCGTEPFERKPDASGQQDQSQDD